MRAAELPPPTAKGMANVFVCCALVGPVSLVCLFGGSLMFIGITDPYAPSAAAGAVALVGAGVPAGIALHRMSIRLALLALALTPLVLLAARLAGWSALGLTE